MPTVMPLDFDTVDKAARNNGYAELNLCEFNNAALSLALDGITARVLVRKNGLFDVVSTFERETYFKGGHWSDIDIDTALNAIAT